MRGTGTSCVVWMIIFSRDGTGQHRSDQHVNSFPVFWRGSYTRRRGIYRFALQNHTCDQATLCTNAPHHTPPHLHKASVYRCTRRKPRATPPTTNSMLRTHSVCARTGGEHTRYAQTKSAINETKRDRYAKTKQQSTTTGATIQR